MTCLAKHYMLQHLICIHAHAGARTGWQLAWSTMVRELAPQDKSGTYTRPGYSFNDKIGGPAHPVNKQVQHT